MNSSVVLDTGPLVAMINARERHNAWASEQFKSVSFPLQTCEPVLTEACFLLGKSQSAVFQMLDAGLIRIGFSLAEEAGTVARLMKKYADVPMSLADACLVRMSEIHDGCKVFTLDSDFKIYKRNGRKTIPLIFPG